MTAEENLLMGAYPASLRRGAHTALEKIYEMWKSVV